MATIGLCFGIPIIATKYVASGISKHDQGQLIIVPPGDVDSLVEAIDQFISSDMFGKTESDILKTDDWIEMVKVLESLSP